MTVTCAIKVPRERFESSRRTQPAQLLKSGCTGSDDDTTDPRLAGFTDDTDDVRFKFIATTSVSEILIWTFKTVQYVFMSSSSYKSYLLNIVLLYLLYC